MRYFAAVLFLSCWRSAFAAEPVTVPLADMLTTSRQEGMQQVGEEFRRPGNEKENKSITGYLKQIYEASRQGASNAFLVDATNAHDAVRASASVLLGGRSASAAVPVEKQRAYLGSHWLVAYLGCGHSDPLPWIVENAAVVESKIQLTYRQPRAFIATSDSLPYYYWIPLGKLAPGTYEIELFDADEQAVTLMRRVEVTAGR